MTAHRLNLKRMPFDEWYYALYHQMVALLPNDSLSYYFWSIDENWKKIKKQKFSCSTVLLFIADNLQYHTEYDITIQERTVHAQTIVDLANANRNTTFIVSTELFNLNKEINVSNVKLICHGGMQTQQKEFTSLLVPEEKNFNSSTIFSCLNKQPRLHRTTVVSYLLGKDLEKFGYISFGAKSIEKWESWLSMCNWCLTSGQSNAQERYIDAGYKKIKGGIGINSLEQVDELYTKSFNNNATNFYNNLLPIYNQTATQIITETNFNELGGNLTEKFLQSVYGMVFPIIIGCVGAVDHLRTVGFDMFDDIINHDYDTIENPFDRIIAAIDLNCHLLCENETKKIWATAKPRFIKNINYAKNGMYKYYELSSLKTLKNILNEQKK